MITYNSYPITGPHVGLHAITLIDKKPHEVVDHVRRWIAGLDNSREIDIQNITQTTDGGVIHTTIWYTEIIR